MLKTLLRIVSSLLILCLSAETASLQASGFHLQTVRHSASSAIVNFENQALMEGMQTARRYVRSESSRLGYVFGLIGSLTILSLNKSPGASPAATTDATEDSVTATQIPHLEHDPSALEQYVRREAPLHETLIYIAGWIAIPAIAAAQLAGIVLWLTGIWGQNPSVAAETMALVFSIVSLVMIFVSANQFVKDHGDWIYQLQAQPEGAGRVVPVHITPENAGPIREFLKRKGQKYGTDFALPAVIGFYLLFTTGAATPVVLIGVPVILMVSLGNSWLAHRRWNNNPFRSPSSRKTFTEEGGWFAAQKSSPNYPFPVPPFLQRLSDKVVEHITNSIFSGSLELGATLSEKDLAKQLWASESMIREALIRMEGRGLVVRVRRKRSEVRNLTREETNDYLQVRAEFDAFLDTLGVIQQTDVEKLQSLASAISDAKDPYAEVRFHHYLWHLVENPIRYALLDQINGPLFLIEALQRLHSSEYRQRRSLEAGAIVAAMADKNVTAVKNLLRDYMLHAHDEFFRSQAPDILTYLRELQVGVKYISSVTRPTNPVRSVEQKKPKVSLKRNGSVPVKSPRRIPTNWSAQRWTEIEGFLREARGIHLVGLKYMWPNAVSTILEIRQSYQGFQGMNLKEILEAIEGDRLRDALITGLSLKLDRKLPFMSDTQESFILEKLLKLSPREMAALVASQHRLSLEMSDPALDARINEVYESKWEKILKKISTGRILRPKNLFQLSRVLTSAFPLVNVIRAHLRIPANEPVPKRILEVQS